MSNNDKFVAKKLSVILSNLNSIIVVFTVKYKAVLIGLSFKFSKVFILFFCIKKCVVCVPNNVCQFIYQSPYMKVFKNR